MNPASPEISIVKCLAKRELNGQPLKSNIFPLLERQSYKKSLNIEVFYFTLFRIFFLFFLWLINILYLLVAIRIVNYQEIVNQQFHYQWILMGNFDLFLYFHFLFSIKFNGELYWKYRNLLASSHGDYSIKVSDYYSRKLLCTLQEHER